MKINFFLNSFFKINSQEAVLYIKGDLFYKENKIDYSDVITLIEGCEKDFLKNLNGFFSFIYMRENKFLAVVDRIRSIPLFYSNINGVLEVSENYKSLDRGYSHDEINKEIFQLCSYTIGNETLSKEIKQLVAGQYLTFNDGQVDISDYYRFSTNDIFQDGFDRDIFKNNVYEALKNTFKRLIKKAGGKQIVVPLSGGYDSRLVASMLKDLNYSNVICFSYGLENNLEAQYSKSIAEKLNLKWIFIEYNSEKWSQLWKSNLSKEYIEFSSNSSSLPHIQDFLAVFELKRKKLVDEDAIFVPGHCCVTAYITSDVLKEGSIEKIDIQKKSLKNIATRHFSLCPLNQLSHLNTAYDLEFQIFEKIKNNIDLESGLVNSVVMYNWRERQSKYIANSVKVYEFFGFDWWLPLWDLEFMEEWTNLPHFEKVDRKIFKETVSNIYNKQTGIEHDIGNARTQSLLYKFIARLISFVPINLQNIVKNIYRKNEYKNHYLGFDIIVKENDLIFLTKKGYKIIGVYCYLYLNEKWSHL